MTDDETHRAVHCPACLAQLGWRCEDTSTGFRRRVEWVHPERAELYAKRAAQGLVPAVAGDQP